MKKKRIRQTLEKRKRKLQKGMMVLIGVLGLLVVIKGLIDSRHKETQVLNQVSDKEWSNNLNENNNQGDRNEYQETIVATREDLAKGNLVLVNNEHPIRTYNVTNLVTMSEYKEGHYKLKDKSMQFNQEAMEALNQMLKDFERAVGEHELIIISGYRDFDEQEKIHYETLISKGAEYTNQYVAKPDRSEHHTGLAVDFGIYHTDGTSSEYDGKGIYSWINDNCSKYGFILRYPSGKQTLTGMSEEPWHFRYVGKVHAEAMNELNLCLEEYIAYLKNYSYYVNPGQGITKESKNYSIYYVATENEITYIPVPQSKKYTISGNNEDGFIVTVPLD